MTARPEPCVGFRELLTNKRHTTWTGPGAGRFQNALIRYGNGARASACLAILVVIAGCSANPVTGENELVLFSTEYEINTGENYYLPAQQAGGGRYTADPALSAYVASVGKRIAAVSDRTLPFEFVVLNDSTPNAWALPGGKIAINRGLLVELDNEAELAAVLAHEIVHAAARHGAQAMNRDLIFNLIHQAAALSGKASDELLGVGRVAFHLVGQRYSRDAEREADYHGIRYMRAAGYDASAAVTLQEKFLALATSGERDWLSGLFASHPPSAERVANNRAASAAFPPGGDLGRARYQGRMAYLLDRRSAYGQADQANRLFEESPADGLRLIEEAVHAEPREARFHGIRGKVLARQGRLIDAVDAYGAAISRGADYFEHFLGRGLAYRFLDDRTRAKADLERSIQLLPTALASYVLGDMMLAEGRRPEAKRLFESVGNAGGPIGAAAREDFVILDIADRPQRHVSARPVLDNGRILVEIGNTTAHTLRGVALRIDADVNGTPISRRLPNLRLEAHARRVVDSGLYYRDTDAIRVAAKVLRAVPVTEPREARPYRAYP